MGDFSNRATKVFSNRETISSTIGRIFRSPPARCSALDSLCQCVVASFSTVELDSGGSASLQVCTLNTRANILWNVCDFFAKDSFSAFLKFLCCTCSLGVCCCWLIAARVGFCDFDDDFAGGCCDFEDGNDLLRDDNDLLRDDDAAGCCGFADDDLLRDGGRSDFDDDDDSMMMGSALCLLGTGRSETAAFCLFLFWSPPPIFDFEMAYALSLLHGLPR